MSDVLLKELRNIATALGISTEGKSAEDLSALIKGSGQKPPAPSTSLIDPNALVKHFEEGRFTDCTIRVKIRESDEYASDRPAKRLRSEEGKGAEINMLVGGGEDPHTLQAHAVILASRSAYFERAMGGEWRESQDRSFEVVVADEQEYVTFRRLIKLCYGTTFIKEGDRDLDVSELVRLIHVANAFECMDAVRQCTVALQEAELDWEMALECIELTNMLKGVEGMGDLAEEAGEVLAKEVGHIHELFTPVEEKNAKDGGDVLGGLRLSAKVKDLSPTAFEALLSSEGLQLKTENEAFWLLLAWVEAQSEESEEGKQELFTRMAKHLRFRAMDPGYVLLLVSKHPRVLAAGLQGQILMDSLIRANLTRREAGQVDHMDTEHGFKLSSGRAPSGKVSWTKEMTFTAADIAGMTSVGTGRCKEFGLVAGIPWTVQLDREDNEGTHQAALFTGCKPPRGWDSIETGKGPLGFFFTYCLAAGATRRRSIKQSSAQGVWTDSIMWGGDVAAWEEVFAEGSEWLRDGGLDVKMTITTCNDQGALDE